MTSRTAEIDDDIAEAGRLLRCAQNHLSMGAHLHAAAKAEQAARLLRNAAWQRPGDPWPQGGFAGEGQL